MGGEPVFCRGAEVTGEPAEADRGDGYAERVLLASGESFIGQLRAGDRRQGWTFEIKDPLRTRHVPANELVRFGAAPLPDKASGLLLVDGSELVGEIVELNSHSCRLVNRWFDVSVPLEQVRSLFFHAPVADLVRDRQRRFAMEARGADDVVLLVDGQRRTGTLRLASQAIMPRQRRSAIEVKAGEGEIASIPIRRIRSIILSPILRPPEDTLAGAGQGSGRSAGEPPTRTWLGLHDGSLLNVVSYQMSSPGDAAHPVLQCGLVLKERAAGRGVPLSEMVAMLAPLPLPASCLIAKAPLRFRHVPFFGEPQPLVRWSAEEIGPALSGQRYPTGLAMGSASRTVYAVSGASRLVGAVAAARDPRWVAVSDAQIEANLGVGFRVESSDAKGNVKLLWESDEIRPGQPAVPFDIDISGGVLLILAVEPSAAGDFGDRALWFDLIAAGARE